MKGIKYLAFFCLIGLALIIGFDYYHEGKTVTAIDTAAKTEEKTAALPTVGSSANLAKILENAQPSMFNMRTANGAADSAVMEKAAAPQTAASGSTAGGGAYAADYSQTNVQVQGVDEADTMKTDGEYIYKITGNKLIVAKAYPAEEMKVVSTLDYGQEMHPMEMYVDDKYLIVILNNSYYHLREKYPVDSGNSGPDTRMPLPPFENSVKVLIYDLSDRSNLQQIREVEIDGSYVSSRKIGRNLYIVNNKYIQVYLLKDQPEALTTPAYRDSASGEEIKRIGYEEICYFPGTPEPNYLIIAGINLDTKSNQQTEVKTYLGAGQTIYASQENLFVAVPEYQYEQIEPVPLPEPAVDPAAEPAPDSLADPPAPAAQDSLIDSAEEPLPDPATEANEDIAADTAVSSKMRVGILPEPRPIPRMVEENIGIYKFNLQDGHTQYIGKGSVPGRILNQFSMDEHNGFFRIATTEQEYGANEVLLSNNLFILDEAMNISGKLENIAPEERIYSVRFLGDRGYMVTFKTVDPLFVLDLKDPYNPGILGELKIPGYSNYLHPYDENHIIGFGKETVEVEEPHWSGEGTVKNAYYLGMKIALFDVSDVNNPREKFKIEIGDRGTDSELFWNHKALLFSKEKNILAFPVTVYDSSAALVSKDDYLVRKDPWLAYGVPVFQGAFVYNLSLNQGFELKGMITHQPQGSIIDLQRTGRYDYNLDISRSMYIADTFYTISNSYLQANDINSLEEIGGIRILNGN